MRYVNTRFREKRRERAYRFYVGEALRIISENTARIGGGEYMTATLADITGENPTEPQDADFEPGEISAKIKSKLRGGGMEDEFI